MAINLQGTYKDVPAHVFDTDELCVTVLPEFGSRLASIKSKPLGTELLEQNPGKRMRRAPFGDSYMNGEFAGFDEMFPTISQCYYESHPWKGVEMPDHGEVWSLPWEHGISGDELVMTVRGVRFAYRLEKRVRVESNRILISYEAENLSPDPFDFIWAAHPLFVGYPGVEFTVPEGMTSIVNAYPSVKLGPYGRVYDFPDAELADGSVFKLDRMPERNESGYQKYYFRAPVTEGWCSLRYPDTGLGIRLEYPEDTVRYLGMWLNEGGFAGQYNIAPEPATAAMDRVDFSKMWGMNSVLEGFQTKSWYLHITITTP